MPGKTPGNGKESNEIVTGKDLRNITSLKQPPPEFAARINPGANRSGSNLQAASRHGLRTIISPSHTIASRIRTLIVMRGIKTRQRMYP